MRLKLPFLLAWTAILIGTGCTSGAGRPVQNAALALPAAPDAPALGNPVNKYIDHVVVIIQENRSFENFFAGYPGANAPMEGMAGKQTVKLHEITFDGPDLEHSWRSSLADWDNGKMDGFYLFGKHNRGHQAYAYVKRSQVKPYWSMAQQYVLADAMFPTEFGGSFTGHLTLVAGTDDLTPNRAEVDVPSGFPYDCDAVPGTKSSYVTPNRLVHAFDGPFPCFDQFATMADVLDAGHVSWKYYATMLKGAGMWEPFEAIKYVRYGDDWNTNISVPQTNVLSDPQNNQLASVSWVSPSVDDSDHPESRSDHGPSWVASVVNAVGESAYWKSTAIVVLWDDWGGWYDNAPPPQRDYRGLGMRVPCIIISPYARKNYVSHTTYEFGSVLKFIEEAFELPNIGPTEMGYTDARAHSLSDAFDFTQQPRAFVPIKSKYGMGTFLREPPSDKPVDTQ